MVEALQARIEHALARIVNARTGGDVLADAQVRDIATTTDGRVRLTLLLAANDDATLARDVRQALERVEGVREVRVDVKDAAEVRSRAATAGQGGAAAGGGATPARRAALPVMENTPQSARAGVPAPTPVAYPNLGTIIAVSSGKGGVGKSTVTVNLAVALAQRGKRVGLMDADIYGPDIPRMMGVNAPPSVDQEKIIPLEAFGVKLMSLGFLIERDQPAIWRGPIVMKIITQFLRDVAWGTLDYLLVDMPPGTGDAQLSLVQATHVTGAIIVTTPQEVAVGDSLRGAKMFERVGVPVLGVVENMSYLPLPDGTHMDLFGRGGGEQLAKAAGAPFIGAIPIDPEVRKGGDSGNPIVIQFPESPAARALVAVAQDIAAKVSVAAMRQPDLIPIQMIG
ncbi:MAG TPA: Mrp/NBP35 family ATP-binding protein [Gemmatimonadaceae bacterium]|nr:Mrp/NBP35 family ATP-binding protein [Gemmatimonadaceae bacterium]